MTHFRPWRLAFRDLVHRPGRTASALAGVIFAIVLLFMQSGFYLACRDSATRIHDLLDFDLMVTSARYSFILKADSIERSRLEQVRGVPGVSDVLAVRVGPGQWRSPESGTGYDLVLLGVDPAERPFSVQTLNEDLARLHRGETVIFDARAHPVLGTNPVGSASEFDSRRLRVVDTFDWGAGFVANGLAVTSETTFAATFPRRPRDAVQLGLVRVTDDVGAAVAGESREDRASAIASRIRQRLPTDVKVWTRKEIKDRDRTFFLRDRPIGLMFTSGVVLAVLVGGVILFQLLAAEVSSRQSELATLKALGYRNAEVYVVVVARGFLYTLLAFVPALGLAAVLFDVTRQIARLPMRLEAGLVVSVLVASVLMCLSGAMVAARKVRRADPADLF